MSLSRAIALGLAVCFLAPGCASSDAASGETTTTADKIAELRAQRKRDRARLRQLEEEMAKVASEGHARGDAPTLPVEHLKPSAPIGTPAETAEVVAIADDGTEIVYVGEAAQSTSVTADTNLLRERSKPRRRRAPAAARRTARPTPAAVIAPITNDSLGVTARRLPKVGDVTKSAPSPKARETVTEARRAPRRPGNAPANAISDYQRHVASLKAGNHGAAIAGFRHFVKRYGRSDYADNAQYWLGEAFYDRKMYRKALVEFAKVARIYPNGNKVPDARLKLAYCKLGLGDKSAARSLLSALIDEFPGSRVAELAGEKLKRIAD